MKTRARDVRRVYRGVDLKRSMLGFLVTQGFSHRPVAFVPRSMANAREIAEAIAAREPCMVGWGKEVWDLRRKVFRSWSGLFRMLFYRIDRRGRRLRGGGFDCLTYERHAVTPPGTVTINAVISGEERWPRERLLVLMRLDRARAAAGIARDRELLKRAKKRGSPQTLSLKPDCTRNGVGKMAAA